MFVLFCNLRYLDLIFVISILSPLTGQPIDINVLIGQPWKKNATRNIIKGSSLKITYRLKSNEIFDSSSGRLVSI